MRGPQSGGTEVVIQGSHLNVGSSVSVSFDGLPCVVNTSQASSARVTCKTSRSNGPRRVDVVTVNIDNAVRTLNKNPYNYTLDPTIMEIKPLKVIFASPVCSPLPPRCFKYS
jgi:plexin A